VVPTPIFSFPRRATSITCAMPTPKPWNADALDAGEQLLRIGRRIDGRPWFEAVVAAAAIQLGDVSPK